MELKELIAEGGQSKVYKSGDAAIKVFRKGYPKEDALYEALNTARVENTGLKIPCIREVSYIDSQWAITMDLIEGKTLSDVIKDDPSNIDKYIELMVDIQLEIHSKKVPQLNKLKDKLVRQINSLDVIDATAKYDLLTRLDGMPKHTKLCHGDFNPSNIIIKDNDIYILDWTHASQGNASADAARTYLLLALDSVETADLYMKEFCKRSNTAKQYVQNWIPIVAAAQLTKGKPQEKELLMKWLDVVDYV